MSEPRPGYSRGRRGDHPPRARSPVVHAGHPARQCAGPLQYPEVGAAVLFHYAILTALSSSLPGAIGSGTSSLEPSRTSSPTGQWGLTYVMADVANIARASSLRCCCVERSVARPAGSVRALGLFVLGAVMIAPAVGDARGGGRDAAWRSDDVLGSWRGWFMSNALTGLTLLPALVLTISAVPSLWSRIERTDPRGHPADCGTRRDLRRGIAVARPAPWRRSAASLPLPALIWAALRFGPAGASLALTLVAFGAIWAADRGTGPFMATPTDTNVLLLQVFLLLTTLPVLCIAAVNSGRHKVVQLYHALLASLHDHVAILDAHGIVLEVNDSWRRFANNALVERFHRVDVGDDYVAACRFAAERGDATRYAPWPVSGCHHESRRFEMEYDEDRTATGSATP